MATGSSSPTWPTRWLSPTATGCPPPPGLFQPVMQRLIEKILLPEVWMYWRDVSRGGSVFNAHLASELTEQWDPFVRDNIMYSAYVQSIALPGS